MTPRDFFRAIGHFWSSDVNVAAVTQLKPRAGETILDIGAGMGPSTIQIAAQLGDHGRVIAMDPSRSMRITLWLRAATNRHRARIEQCGATAEALPQADSTIDAAIGLNVMHHLADVSQTVNELARVIRPGGRVLLIDEDFDDPRHSFHEPEHRHGSPAFVDPAELTALLTAAGFSTANADLRTVGSEPAYVITAIR